MMKYLSLLFLFIFSKIQNKIEVMSFPSTSTVRKRAAYTSTSQKTIPINHTRNGIDLPWNDINIVILTDVHSWVAGHSYHESNTSNADYGDILSFYKHLQLYCEKQETRDLFFVMNGDFLHGTGMSSDPPTFLIPILEQMPWDAITIGNHELFYQSTIEYLTKPNDGFVDYWNGTYVTTNVRLNQTGTYLGSPYTFLKGTQSNTTILTFGFLYDMTNEDPSSIVDKVEDVVQHTWFREVLSGNQGSFDVILILAHMDLEHPLLSVILHVIRDICGDDIPVQFITGHSHIRRSTEFDPKSVSVEAGRFLDTLGFVSFSKEGVFDHAFIDTHVSSFMSILNIEDPKDFPTSDGKALSQLILETQVREGLLDVIACAPQSYFLNRTMDKEDSLFGLFLKDVVPNYLFHGNSSKIMINERHDFWYNLYDGKLHLNVS